MQRGANCETDETHYHLISVNLNICVFGLKQNKIPAVKNCKNYLA